jgi:predicted MPP superfamily phosphohydrolase
MSQPSPARRRPSFQARVVLYLVLSWGTLATLAGLAEPAAGGLVAALALYTTVPLVAFARWRGWPFYPDAWFRLAVVRPFWYVQLLLPVVTLGALAGMIGGLAFGHAIDGGQLVALAVLATCSAVLVAGYIGAGRLVVRRVDAFLPGLDPAFDGVRIAQLSDLHIGPHSSRRFLRRVVHATHAQAPDIIAVTGDMVDDRAEDVAIFEETLGALRAPLGKFLIPGNHDVYAGWDDVERAFARLGSGTLLVNDAHVIRRGGAMLALVGTGDPAGGPRGSSRAAPDVARALSRVPPGATVIALAHNPALWPLLAERGVALTLSGHTHWGQLALPGRGWSLATPFLERAMAGHQLRDALLYISPGTGYWGVPFRLGAFPEVTIVTLRRAEVASVDVHEPAAA